MISKIIEYMHLLLTIFIAVYVFCIEDKYYDYIYLGYIYFVLLHWTFLKGECIISYWFKKLRNNDYKLGTDFINDDFEYLLSGYRQYILILVNILMVVNIYMVCKRNNIHNYIIILFALVYITFFVSYALSFYYFDNYHINKNYLLVNNILQILLILFGLYIYINKDNINE